MPSRVQHPLRIRSLRGACCAILLLLPLAKPDAAAQPPVYVSKIWRTQDGLPENRIRALAQTPDGYLWVGTSSGLARFDGVRFVVYARFNTPSMTDDNIRALAVAADGSLWVATDGGGLLHYQNGRFQSFGPKEGLTNEFVIAIAVDRRGDVWAGTNRGLFRRHGEKFERVDEKLHLPNIAFFALGEARDGRIFAGGPSGLFCFENGELRPYDKGHDLDGVYHIERGQRRIAVARHQPRARDHRRSSADFRPPRRHQE